MKFLYTYLLLIIVSAIKAQTPNFNITLNANVVYTGATSNICGYVDTTGKEYALVGWQFGMEIVDVSNPNLPIRDTNFTGPTSIWREIKVYKKFAYVTTEGGGGLQIIDMTNLPNYKNLQAKNIQPVIGSQTLNSIHALHIDTTKGYAYLYGSNLGFGGAYIFDLLDPWNPVYIGKYDRAYVHDGYVDNDTLYAGHIYEGTMSIVNMQNKLAPQILSTTSTPNNFTHNTWPTVDKKYILTTDEINGSNVGVYDIQNPTSPNLVTIFTSQNPNTGSLCHNTHIKNNFAYTSWYTDGVVITDITRPDLPINVAWYDPNTITGGMQNGVWGVYPFLPSGTIVATDMQLGLYVLTPNINNVKANYVEGNITDGLCSKPMSFLTISLKDSNLNNIATYTTNSFGDFKFGMTDTLKKYIVISKSGYTTQTITINNVKGQTTIANVILQPIATISYNLITSLNTVVNVLDSVSVSIVDTLDIEKTTVTYNGLTFYTFKKNLIEVNAQTNSAGNLSYNCLVPNTYNIFYGKWGYNNFCEFASLTGGTYNINKVFTKKYEDNFNVNLGWNINSTATSGAWERAYPVPSVFGPSLVSLLTPAFDDSADCGEMAYFTGTGFPNTDVDGGYTELTSPPMDLTTFINPEINFSQWLVNYGGFSPIRDSLLVTLSNGITEVTVAKYHKANTIPSQWNKRKITNIASKIAITNNMVIKFKAEDYGNDNDFEVGIDNFYVTDNNTIGFNNIKQKTALNIYPNPTNSIINIESNTNMQEIKVFDLSGKLVLKEIVNNEKYASIDLLLERGMYMVEIILENKLEINKSLVINE